MKRLTISMSDELFQKLEVMENKSLFIRKLIERELEVLENPSGDDMIPLNENFSILRDDVNSIFSRLEQIENKFSTLNSENKINNNRIQEPMNLQGTAAEDSTSETAPVFEDTVLRNPTPEEGKEDAHLPDIPEDKDIIDSRQISVQSIEKEKNEITDQLSSSIENAEHMEQDIATITPEVLETEMQVTDSESKKDYLQPIDENGHGMKLSEMVSEKINKPETEHPANNSKNPGIAAEELKPPETQQHDNGFVMPEFKTPETQQHDDGFVMPELKPPETQQQDDGFVMPEIKPPEIQQQDDGFVMPEFKTPETQQQDDGFVMPEIKPPEIQQQDDGFVMPEFKTPETQQQDDGFVMTEFKPPETQQQDDGFVIPEFKTPETQQQDDGFVIPEFKTPETQQQDDGFVMPELKTPETQQQDDGFVMPEFKTPEDSHDGGSAVSGSKTQEEIPPFMNVAKEIVPDTQEKTSQMGPGVEPSEEQGSHKRADKLESNILMYMPSGAKVKKEIIKSLVSRQFSQEDIEKKIQELVSRQVLVLRQENGAEHLHRLK